MASMKIAFAEERLSPRPVHAEHEIVHLFLISTFTRTSATFRIFSGMRILMAWLPK